MLQCVEVSVDTPSMELTRSARNALVWAALGVLVALLVACSGVSTVDSGGAGADAAPAGTAHQEDAEPPPKVLNPQDADAGELARLELATFQLHELPPSWVGSYTICTRIARGWSDCVDLSSTHAASSEVSAYVDPESPDVEVWLLDEGADLRAPIAKLKDFRVSADVLGERGDSRTARLTLVLPTNRSVEEAARTPEAAFDGIGIIIEPAR